MQWRDELIWYSQSSFGPFGQRRTEDRRIGLRRQQPGRIAGVISRGLYDRAMARYAPRHDVPGQESVCGGNRPARSALAQQLPRRSTFANPLEPSREKQVASVATR